MTPPTHVACEWQTLQMHGFPIQTQELHLVSYLQLDSVNQNSMNSILHAHIKLPKLSRGCKFCGFGTISKSFLRENRWPHSLIISGA